MPQRNAKSVLSMRESARPVIEDARFTTAISLIDTKIIPEALLRQVLLHLHRFSLAELTDPEVVGREVRRIEKRVAAKLERVPSDLKERAAVDLQSTYFKVVDSRIAELVHESYHYLGSPRRNGVHLGLFSPNSPPRLPKLMTLVTLSDFDLPHVIEALPSGIHSDEVLVLSRLFSFPWCPRNAMSRTLGNTFSWILKQRSNVKLLLTYLDPNLGFHGTIYRATNWILFGQEKKKRYLFLDGDYVTDRRMIRQFGTADLRKLASLLGSRLTSSQAALRPLELYAYFLDPRDRAKYNRGFVRELTPPSALVGG